MVGRTKNSEWMMKSSNRKTLKKSQVRRNKQIRNLQELVRRFFIQYLCAAAPNKEVFLTPPRQEDRPWSPRPGAPSTSSIHGNPEPLYCYNPPTDLLDASDFSERSTKPGSEQFRPTTPSYTLSSSLISDSRFPESEFRACSSPLSPPLFPFVPDEIDSPGEDDSISLPEIDFRDYSPSPVPSIEVLEEQPESREVIDPLLELLRRTSTPWTDPVPKGAFNIGPDYFDLEKISRQASQSPPDSNFFIYYPGVETPFLASMGLINLVFPRTTVRVCEIEEITLD
ncbi:hypothetical protein PUN28_004293 [Cardiocondyla obscurior]|uniref:Uncharacterized protein n=1 Tax=Cardiocondyla obscurior TaxID=286306 RepID=A0AAW2GBY3_9HYME